MKHITEWEIDGIENSTLDMYTDEKVIAIVKNKGQFFDNLALLEYEYKENGTLLVKSSDDYTWKLDADFDREVLILDFKDERLNKLFK